MSDSFRDEHRYQGPTPTGLLQCNMVYMRCTIEIVKMNLLRCGTADLTHALVVRKYRQVKVILSLRLAKLSLIWSHCCK
jgi:hypothetical protein